MSTRRRQQEDVDEAYEIQSKAAIQGALRSTAIGVGLAIIAHHAWPVFRRQTLAFKGFIVSGFTIFGLVFGAESALLTHETMRRREEAVIRREARLDLARQGLVGTETEIAKWREAREQQASES
ncbi:hypothetical protein K443DRAFT_119079 [Laccaria amethystina LaAM-08-1]|uniref:Cytochrome c oxidase assembly protein COX20, mitochondrial n=1 Tax=Laccaria amethystina LaAM-08-1 TaxID=1095629 RepID=A0A0C9Y3H3_9AGAR|nr:hypothetical protein K443DRAFT_119079 [Laccaria amethystina LaAM-08-1]